MKRKTKQKSKPSAAVVLVPGSGILIVNTAQANKDGTGVTLQTLAEGSEIAKT